MNFKLTKLKVIISIVVGLILGFILALKTTGFDLPLTISTSLLNSSIFWFLILFVITYLIWSLIQKKK